MFISVAKINAHFTLKMLQTHVYMCCVWMAREQQGTNTCM